MIRGTGLGSDDTAAEPGGKADVRHIAMCDLRQLFWIGICKVEIAAEHGDIDVILCKNIFHIHGKSRGQCLIGSWKLGDHLTGCQMSAGKAKLMDIGNTFLKRKLFRIM